jgi:rhodanese-related sulfurtransferase
MSKRSLLLVVIIGLALVLAACGGDKDKDDSPASFTTVTVQEAFDQLGDNDTAVIVDVRNPDEWAATGIPPGAALIPLPEFEQRAPNELPKDADIYVICNSGNRSRPASQQLIDLGYTSVYNIDGGIQAWMSANLPTESYPN